MKRAIGVAALWLATAGMQAADAPDLSLWRLDCGEIHVSNLDEYSDTFLYVGQQKTLTDSCYLIKDGAQYLLWDTGLPGELKGRTDKPEGLSLRALVRDQLAEIGVEPDEITFVGISHHHFDHIGQAADFPGASLLVGSGDWDVIQKRKDRAERFVPWISGGGKVEPISGDRDVFGDGRVVMLSTPGHTPGHHSLLVRLPETGPVLLTGDVYHFMENVKNRGVPSFNTNRSDSLASMDRFDRIAANLKAKVIIQHEARDIGKLPAFPEAAH
jgi:glyoxylase-like metal-dependent hydrolase (beta-lactamase superfamily II)